MANGTFLLTQTLNGNKVAVDGRIVWSSQSNGTSQNSSKVTAELQIRKPNGATTTGTWKGSFTVGAKTITLSEFMAVNGDWTTLATITTTVAHESNGEGFCYLNAVVNGPTETTVSGSKASGSTTVTLDKIARFATIISAEDFTDEGNPTIKYSNPAGAAVSRLQACISLTGESADIPFRDIPIDGNTYKFELTSAERDLILSASASSNTLNVKFVVRSTIDDVTDTDSVIATMTVVNADPTASITVEDTNATTKALTGDNKKLIALHSVASVSMTVAAKKSATIPSGGVTVTNGSNALSGAGSFSGTLSPVADGEITYTVTDSRGNQTTGKATNTIVHYFDPQVAITNAKANTAGEVELQAKGKVFNGSFGSKANSITIKYRYKLGSGDYGSWTTISSPTYDGNDFVASALITGLNYQKRYTFQVAVYDSLHSNGVISKSVGTKAIPVFDWSEEDFRFNVPLDMAGNKIAQLASPVDTADAVTLGYLNTLGLGAGGKHTTDLNNEKTTGWYSFSNDCANRPFKFGVAMVIRRYNSDVTQIAFNPYMSSGNGSREICVRSFQDSWGEWEYINPPMVLGTEYRTTERYLGNPVYVKTVNFGELPSNSSKNALYFSTDPGATAIDVRVILSTGCVLSSGYGKDRNVSSSYGMYIDNTRFNVRIATEGDFSGVTAIAVVKYIKD